MDTVELDRLISKRASQDRTEDPDEREPGYMESVRRYNARIEDENRALWCSYHMAQARRLRENLEALIAEHEAKAMKLSNPEGEA
jgi:hypothetical protein